MKIMIMVFDVSVLVPGYLIVSKHILAAVLLPHLPRKSDIEAVIVGS